jgi:hypothetical protein
MAASTRYQTCTRSVARITDPEDDAVASFARRVTKGRWRVAVRGRLRAADLRRLERACAPALEQYPLPLDIDVNAMQGVDEPSRRFVRCLLRRGAALVGDDRAQWDLAIGQPVVPSGPDIFRTG